MPASTLANEPQIPVDTMKQTIDLVSRKAYHGKQGVVMIVKRAAFCLVVVFLLVSCGKQEWDDTVIINNSGFSVIFRFNHTGEITLVAGGSYTFETRVHQHLEWFRYEGQEMPGNPVLVRFVYIATNYGATGEFRLVCLCEDDDCDSCNCGNEAKVECDDFCDCDSGGDDEPPALEDDSKIRVAEPVCVSDARDTVAVVFRGLLPNPPQRTIIDGYASEQRIQVERLLPAFQRRESVARIVLRPGERNPAPRHAG